VDGVAGFDRAGLEDLLVDVDFQFLQVDAFGPRDRGEGQDDSATQGGNDKFSWAAVTAPVLCRGFHHDSAPVDLHEGIFAGQAYGDG
jgi:hypothetical protein